MKKNIISDCGFMHPEGHKPQRVVRDTISHSEISKGLTTDFIGRDLHIFDELASTNTMAHELALDGAPEGTTVLADSQKNGKGRRGRSWFSPSGKNIYTSVVLRPDIDPGTAPQLTLLAAVALAETVSRTLKGLTPRKAEIKWPNDIMAGGKKCAGILTEMKAESGRTDYVVIGIGVNINTGKEDIPDLLSDIATSLSIEAGRNLPRTPILQALYINLENWYKMYLKEGFSPVKERWNFLSGINGKYVRAASVAGIAAPEGGGGGYEEGTAIGINDEGALLLKKEDGRVMEIKAGDVTWPPGDSPGFTGGEKRSRRIGTVPR